jgi:hypothetical protein
MAETIDEAVNKVKQLTGNEPDEEAVKKLKEQVDPNAKKKEETKKESTFTTAQRTELSRALTEEKDAFGRNIEIHAGARHNRLLGIAAQDHIQIPYCSDAGVADSLEGPAIFDKTETLTYHKASSSQYEQLVSLKSEVADMQRQLTLTAEDYEKKNIPLPANFMSLSKDVKEKEKKYYHSLLRVLADIPDWLEDQGEQTALKDLGDAWDLRTRLSIVNLAPTSSNTTSSGYA